jgi:hypothetical protein
MGEEHMELTSSGSQMGCPEWSRLDLSITKEQNSDHGVLHSFDTNKWTRTNLGGRFSL